MILKLDDHSDISKDGYGLVLKRADGSIHSKLKARDGVDKDGFLTFEYKDLDPEIKYVLEMHNEKDEILVEIFSDKKHGEWELDEENTTQA